MIGNPKCDCDLQVRIGLRQPGSILDGRDEPLRVADGTQK